MILTLNLVQNLKFKLKEHFEWLFFQKQIRDDENDGWRFW